MKIQFMEFCNGWFIKDGANYETHRVLLRYENDKGVNYRLEKFDADKIDQDNYDFGSDVRPLYDRYGRICSM